MASSHCVIIDFLGLLLIFDFGLDDLVVKSSSELRQDACLLKRERICAFKGVFFAVVNVGELNTCDSEGTSQLSLDTGFGQRQEHSLLALVRVKQVLAAALAVLAGHEHLIFDQRSTCILLFVMNFYHGVKVACLDFLVAGNSFHFFINDLKI